MIDCREAVGRMWAYLSQGLDTDDTRTLEEHLGVCQRCCGELEFSKQLRAKVAGAETERLPGRVRARIDELLREGEPRPGDQP
ncbi:MAG: anti-sigma factor family protein [Candidatus Limnocylindria bacterium]